MSKELVEVTYDSIKRETDKAILFVIGDEEVWIPTSQIDGDSGDLENEGGTIEIPEWLATEKELV